jgi:hypothetical protein
MLFRIPIYTYGNHDGLPYLCKFELGKMFDESDIPTKCDAVLKLRKQGESPPNRYAYKIHLPTNFENKGVEYQTHNGRWMRDIVLTVSADCALGNAGVTPGKYWFWLERN